jgi:FixJ family two-component response regulator
MPDEPSRQDLAERLIRVETRVDALTENEREIRKIVEGLRSRVNQIAEDLKEIIGEQRSTRRLIGWGLTVVTIILGALQLVA